MKQTDDERYKRFKRFYPDTVKSTVTLTKYNLSKEQAQKAANAYAIMMDAEVLYFRQLNAHTVLVYTSRQFKLDAAKMVHGTKVMLAEKPEYTFTVISNGVYYQANTATLEVMSDIVGLDGLAAIFGGYEAVCFKPIEDK